MILFYLIFNNRGPAFVQDIASI